MTYPLKVRPAFALQPWHAVANTDAELISALEEAVRRSPIGEAIVITDPEGF